MLPQLQQDCTSLGVVSFWLFMKTVVLHHAGDMGMLPGHAVGAISLEPAAPIGAVWRLAQQSLHVPPPPAPGHSSRGLLLCAAHLHVDQESNLAKEPGRLLSLL